MLTSLALRNFKSFVDERVGVSPFTLLVGVNASGKSNFFDAIRFLQGLSLGYSIPEVLSGRYEGGVPIWRGIRGAANEIALDDSAPVMIETGWKIGGDLINHSVQFTVSEDPRIVAERLSDKSGAYLFDTHAPSLGGLAGPTEGGGINVAFKRAPGGSGGRSPSATFPADKSILSRRLALKNIHDKVVTTSEKLILEMSGALFLDLQPSLMRDFKSAQIRALGVNGENISSALFDLCKDPDKKISVVDWISELCAPEVSDIDFVKTEFEQVMFVLVEDNGRRISAKSVSDGTLRFLGQLVALLTAKAGALLLIEELENGLHPSRQSLLVEAIEGYVEASDIQVIASTHSPTLMEALKPTALENAIIFGRSADMAGTTMKNLGDLPNFKSVLRDHEMGELFNTLWLERAL